MGSKRNRFPFLANPMMIPPTFNEEDAFRYIVGYLRGDRNSRYELGGRYGHDLYLPHVMRQYLVEVVGFNEQQCEAEIQRVSSIFYAAAWELCRRGILRPGRAKYAVQSSFERSDENGYSITPRGEFWLNQAGQYDFVPTEPGRFAKILDSFSSRYGEGFRDRSQEAIRCYGALTYLACCAMCGAAAESILLAIAIAKTQDEPRALKIYSASGGRKKIEDLIIGQQPRPTQDEFRGYLSLLKYWRDTAAHGRVSNLSENEAFTSLAVLLRLAQFANQRWGELTQTQ